MAPKYVLGVDGGTGGIRAGLFDVKTGVPVGFADTPYKTTHPDPGYAEQNPRDWWLCLGKSTRRVLAETGVKPESVVGMCCDTTCCTVVALDEKGDAIMPSILWMDMRAAEQTEQVLATGDPALRVCCGGAGPVSAEWMIPKALWVKQRKPLLWESAAMICEYQDFLNLKLTGKYVASGNNVAVRWHFVDGEPPVSLLEKLELSDLVDKWPKRVVAPGDTIGDGLTCEAAAHLGLAKGTPVAQGGADAFIAMLGLGVVSPGQLALITGSSHLHLGVVSHENKEMAGRGVFGAYRNALPGVAGILEGGQTSTGSVVRWYKELLTNTNGGDTNGGDTTATTNTNGGDTTTTGDHKDNDPDDDFYAKITEQAKQVPIGCEGLIVQEHFQGNRTPHVDPTSRGVLVGLTLKHGRAHLFRAILEGVSFGTRLIFETMAQVGYTPTEVVVAGGATRSELWLQIHADVAGIPFRKTKCHDAPALGCAVLAAVAAGCYPAVPAAVKAMVHFSGVVTPNKEAHAAYASAYAAYKATYHATKHIGRGQAPRGGDCDVATAKRKTNDSPGVPSRKPTRNKNHLTAIVAPSLLAADQGNLSSEVARMVRFGADWLHVDIMDGHFVPNLTIGPSVVARLKSLASDAFLDCHLSCSDPSSLVKPLAEAGADSVTFHWESVDCDIRKAEQLALKIQALGMRAAIAVKPSTPIDAIVFMLKTSPAVFDMVLCLSVEPGFGGQPFMPAVLPKVKALREAFPRLNIQMDGGVNLKTVEMCAAAGANVVVAGNAVFGASDPEQAIAGLRHALQAELPGYSDYE